MSNLSFQSPGDPPGSPPFWVAGRLTDISDNWLAVSDAFSERKITTSTPFNFPLGSWVAIEVLSLSQTFWRGGRATLIADGLANGDDIRRWAGARARRLRERQRLLRSIASFFVDRNYIEVQTPMLVRSPGLDVHLRPFACANSTYLSTSPEYQMKRMLAGGFPRIFQITRSFRRDEQGPIHEREFTLLEWYRAFCSLESMIAETESLIEMVALCAQNKAELTVNQRQISVTPPFERVTVCQIFSRARGCSEDDALALALSPKAADQETFFRVWADEVVPMLSNMGAIVLTDFPASHASLARKKPNDPQLAERFEIVVGGVELCNAFCELIDPVEQRQRFESDLLARASLGLELPSIDEKFLAALSEGLPPSSGNALGLDRLLALALGAQNIAEVMAFAASEM